MSMTTAERHATKQTPLYPLRFKPIYQYRLWGGVMMLSKQHPRTIRDRSVDPVLTPELPQERHGTIANVVFPTGIDRRDDLGAPDRLDVYYGMADNRIGVARLDVPDFLPPGGAPDPPEAKV
jgi:beta-1,2-mannobiose phosphorylase / 1,2-beta-oligomannan phosphorylase